MSVIFPSETLPEINWDNLLTSGLVALDAFSESVELVKGTTPVFTNSTIVSDGVYGDVVEFGAVDGWVDTGVVPTDGENLTFVAIIKNENLDANCFAAATRTGTSAKGFDLIIGNSNEPKKVGFRVLGQSNSLIHSVDNPSDWLLCVIRINQTDGLVHSYVKELSSGTLYTSSAADSTTTNHTQGLYLSKRGGTTSFSGKMAMYAYYERALNDDEINSLLANPYQLFETAATKRDEYGLGVAEYSGVAITFPRLTFNATEQWFEIKFANYKFTGNNGTHCNIASASNFGTNFKITNINQLSWSSTGVSKVELDGVEITSGTTMPLDGLEHTLRAFTTTTTAWLEGLFQNVGSPFSMTVIEFSASSVEGNYFWIFDKQGTHTTVADEYNSAIATLNGFPEYGGYVYENGECVGYQLNGVDNYASISNAPYFSQNDEWEIEFKVKIPTDTSQPFYAFASTSGYTNYVRIGNNASQHARVRIANVSLDWTNAYLTDGDFHTVKFVRRLGGVHECYIDGISQGIVNNSITSNDGKNTTGRASSTYSKATVAYVLIKDAEDGNTQFYWDYTKGDSDSIPETVNQYHATIVNQPTSGFLPVVEKQIYLVGAGKDYENLQAFDAGELSTNHGVFKRALVSGRFTDGVDIRDWRNPFELIAQEPYDGTNEDTCTAIVVDSGSAVRIWVEYLTGYDVSIDGFAFIGTEVNSSTTFNLSNIASDATFSFELSNSLCKGNHGRGASFDNDANIICRNNRYEAPTDTNIEAVIYGTHYDCIAVGGRYGFRLATVHNCLGMLAGSNGTFNSCSGSNCVSDDDKASSVVGNNSLSNQPVDTWLNADGTINDTGQAVLKGAGWNGSDIASVFYATGGVNPTSVESIKDFSFSIFGNVERAYSVSWSITSGVSSSTNYSWGITEPVNSNKGFSWRVNRLVSEAKDFSWNILESVSKTKDYAWKVLKEVFKTDEVSWGIFQEVSEVNNISWDILREVDSKKSLNWDILKDVGSTKNYSWEITNSVNALSSNKAFSWSILNNTETKKDLSWQVSKEVAEAKDLSWSISEVIQQLKDYSWNVSKSVFKTKGFSYSIREEVSREKDFEWSIFKNINQKVDFLWSIDGYNQVSKTTSISWNISQPIESYREISWNITPALSGKHSPTERSVFIKKEDRLISIPKEIRTYSVK